MIVETNFAISIAAPLFFLYFNAGIIGICPVFFGGV